MSTNRSIRIKVSTDGGATYRDFVESTTTTTTPPSPPTTTTTTPTTPTPPATTTTGAAYDSNGMQYPQPLLPEGFRLSYKNETFSFKKNFRSDGSMRCDFQGQPIRNSVLLAGYFKATGSDDGEEVSAKMNGGPHSDSNASYADTMDLGIINFAGTKSRVRWEKTHPDYSSSISPTYKESVGDIRNKWQGFIGMKVNLDTNGDGKDDKVAIIGMVDVGGLNAEGKPANNWKITFKRLFTPSEIDLKSIWTPYVATIGKPELSQQTIRIDDQSQSAWTSSTNPPYKFVGVKEVNVSRN